MTPHNNAKPGDYAQAVLLPGDPLRAKWIAETFLGDARLVNSVRNCLGYTGTWNGKPVSVQATGMGQPSTAIYAHELPALPLFFRADPFIIPKWLKGIEPTGHQDVSTLWVENWRAVP